MDLTDVVDGIALHYLVVIDREIRRGLPRRRRSFPSVTELTPRQRQAVAACYPDPNAQDRHAL